MVTLTSERSNLPSKEDLKECCPHLFKELEGKYGTKISCSDMNKLFAAHFHDTVQGHQYKENFGSKLDGKCKQSFNHMVSNKDCKEILTFYYNEVEQATDKEAKLEKLELVVNNLSCDDLIPENKGITTKFGTVSMNHFKKALKCDKYDPLREFYFNKGVSNAAGSPGNVRIGDAKINSQIKSRPDLPQNCDFAAMKEKIFETYKKDSGKELHKKPYPNSSSTKREP